MKMKKLMFALAVAMIAGVTQAASMAWGLGSGTLRDGDGNLLTSAPDFKVVLVNVTGLAQDKWTSGTVASTASFSYNAQKGKQNVAGTLKATVDETNPVSYWNSQVYAVMVEKDGNLGYLMNGDTQVTTTFSPAFVNDSTSLTTGYTLPAAAYKAGPIGVPEPTSGMLLVMGLGALALRRRKA